MTFNYTVTGVRRKELVNVISEITEYPASYLGAPSFSYEVGCFTIDRNGAVSFDDSADSEEIEQLIEALLERGFEPEPAEAGEETYGLVVSVPRAAITDTAIENLRRMLRAKGTLIRKALGADNTELEVGETALRFPWFDSAPEHDMAMAVNIFICKLVDMAKTQQRVTATEKETENEKYAFRCFLLRLGFIGDEYKAARKTLLRNLSGSGAFKGGNPITREVVGRIESDADLYDDVMSLQDTEAASNE